MTEKTICGYCHKDIDGVPVSRKIIFRTRDPYTRKAKVGSEYRKFCSEACAHYEQCAMEG